MKRCAEIVRAVALVIGLFGSVLALAQPDGDPGEPVADPAIDEALRLSELGRLHYDGGEFAEAAAAFGRAFELIREPVLGYNAARSYENAGEPEPALALYQAVLELEFDDPAMRQRCRDAVQRIENILARLEDDRQRQPAQLTVESTPAGATVRIDDEPQGETPLEVALPSGTYRVDIELAGRDPYHESVVLEPGQSVGLRVNLRAALQPPLPPDDGGPTWWAVGLSGGLGVVFVALGAGAAAGAHDRFDEAQTAEAQRDDARFDGLVSEGKDLRRASTLLYGLGIAGLATAVLLYFVTDDDGEPDASGSLDVSLGFEPGGAGASVRVRF